MPTLTISRRQRRALNHFLIEQEALFEALEDDRTTPLPEALAHRGRAAVAGALRLLAGTSHQLPPLPDTSPLLPVALFVALAQVTCALERHFHQPRQALAKIYPRASRGA